MNIKWTDAEKKYIRDNAHRLKMRQKLGVKKQSGRGICKIEPKKDDTQHFIK